MLDKDRRTGTEWLLPERESQTEKKSSSKARYLAMKDLLAKEKEATRQLGGKINELNSKYENEKKKI